MAEWLYEDGIGENRAILVDDGEIVEAEIELPETLAAGTIITARLVRILAPATRGIVSFGDGEALLEPVPRDLTQGQALRVEITREAVPEPARPKLPRCRATEAPERPGESLRERIGSPPSLRPPAVDRFEQAGWSELLEQAASGEIPFQGGALRMSLTPAMTLFDVDGALPPDALAKAGASAAARTIRRFGIGGSIGIDLPTVPAKAERQAAAAAVDEVLPPPFERTAVNGFGFLQIVRRRERASLPELIQADPAGAAARALLRRAQWSPGAGERTIHAAAVVIDRLGSRQDWLDELSRRLGAPVALRAEPGLSISAGHVHSRA